MSTNFTYGNQPNVTAQELAFSIYTDVDAAFFDVEHPGDTFRILENFAGGNVHIPPAVENRRINGFLKSFLEFVSIIVCHGLGVIQISLKIHWALGIVGGNLFAYPFPDSAGQDGMSFRKIQVEANYNVNGIVIVLVFGICRRKRGKPVVHIFVHVLLYGNAVSRFHDSWSACVILAGKKCKGKDN